MKHAADFHTQTPVEFVTRHPTPEQIRAEITHQLMQDSAKHPIGGVVPFIPSRVANLVDKAISDACKKYGSYQ